MSEVHLDRNRLSHMNDDLIKVGIGVFHGKGNVDSPKQAARELVTKALKDYDPAKLPVRFALLMATSDWCQSGINLSAHIRIILKDKLGHQVPLIGGSSSQLYVSTEPDPSSRFIENGIWLVLFFTEDMWLTVTKLEKPYNAKPEGRRENLRTVVKELEFDAFTKLRTSANRLLFGFLPGVLKDKNGHRAYYDHELHGDILAALNHRHLFFGASTTNQLEPTAGYQFANDECLQSGLALAMLETDLCLGAALSHGFSKSDAPRVSIDGLADADENDAGYELTHLDGISAFDRIDQLRKENKEWVRFDRPIFGLPDGMDYNIYWPLEPISPNNTNIRLKRKVTKGDRFYLLDATAGKMLGTAQQAIEKAIIKSTARQRDICLLISFLCGGRGQQFGRLGVEWKEAVEKARLEYEEIPIVGALTAGEFSIDEMHKARSNNLGISIISTANVIHRRAKVRELNKRLVHAAGTLLTCQTPKEVMRKALEGAIATGALGGTINIVDHKLKRILGKNFGYALDAYGSPQDWRAVANFTDYEMPTGDSGDFPIELRDTSMPIVPDRSEFRLNFVTTIQTRENGEREDVLQMAIRTIRAVFIPDSTIYKGSLINQSGCEAGNIKSQLVIPLVGKNFKAISTMQLSFWEDNPPDRETMALWVSYAQSVAAALEQAEEHELRRSLEEISEIGNRVMNTPLASHQTPYDWCQEYLVAIAKLLGTDGANIRTLERSESEHGKSYRLRASNGIFGRILENSLPEIPESDPGFHKQYLEEGGKFVNQKAEATSLFAEMEPLEKPELYRTELKRILGLVEATAILPINNQQGLIGALYLYSTKQYFFTDRQQKLARAAAELAGSILQAKKTEYERMEFDRQLECLDKLLMLQTEGTASERLRLMLQSVCETVEADIGSIFAWYDTSEKLVLHTWHNWSVPNQEGKAGYKKGEGWTGSLVEKEKDIVYITPPDSDDNKDIEHAPRKHYELMVPSKKRSPKEEARIGIRLVAREKLLGVMTLVYYKEHTTNLINQQEFITNYLKGATRYINLCFELVQKDARDDRTRKFFDTKEQISKLLIDNAQNQQNWQLAMDAILKCFGTETLTYYQLQADKLIKHLNSSLQDDLRPKELSLSSALFKKVIEDKNVIRDSPSYDLGQWPEVQNKSHFMAVPVVTSNGKTVGLLEFVNRPVSPVHPFNWFDSLDSNLAADIADSLAAAIEREEKASLRSQLENAMEIGGRGLFSTILMHQIKSPFGHMRGIIDWLLKHPDNPKEERASYLNHIEKYYSQALETISQAGQRGYSTPSQHNLQTIVREAIRFITPDLQAKGVKLIESNDLLVEVSVDLMSIAGALVNLLSNAIEAVDKDGVLTVSTEVSKDSSAALVRIHNTCEPLTETDIIRLSQPGASTKRDGEHLGMGIWLANQAISKTGGTLRFNPTIEGVEAIVSLPLADKQQAITQGPKEFYYETVKNSDR